MLKKYWRLPAAILGATAVYIAVLFLAQDYLLFYPDSRYINPQQAETPYFQELPITSPDGKKIMSWFYEGKADKPIILFFHGNAGQIARFAPQMKTYINEGYSILMPEFRGFAGSKGYLSESAMYNDAEMWFDFLRQELGYRRIVVFGYSMGTAPASRLAGTRKPDAVILAAPFYSLRREVADKKVLFATWVLKRNLESNRYIAEYVGPLLIIHGSKDKLIKPQHGEDLFKLSPSEDKTFDLIAGVNHFRLFFDEQYHKRIAAWLRSRFQ